MFGEAACCGVCMPDTAEVLALEAELFEPPVPAAVELLSLPPLTSCNNVSSCDRW